MTCDNNKCLKVVSSEGVNAFYVNAIRSVNGKNGKRGYYHRIEICVTIGCFGRRRFLVKSFWEDN